MMSLILIVIVPCLIPQVTRCHQPDSIHLQMKSDTTAIEMMKRFKRQASREGSGASLVCPEGTFGQECKSNCTCNTTNTMTCDKVNGSCTCKNGWNGTICGEDIDECQKTTVCANIANSTCRNTFGSYSCDCVTGFFKSGDVCYAQNCPVGQNNCAQLCTKNSSTTFTCFCLPGYSLNSDGVTCDVCPSNTYGIACTSNCTCNTTNALTCDKVNGTCTCKNGWSGLTCDDDVDECQSLVVCDAKPDSSCTNFPGSYFCACNSGFFESNDLCEAADKFKNYSVSVRFDVSVDFPLNDEKDPRYIALSEAIQKTLAEHFNQSIGIAFYSITVVSLRNGSVIADTELQVNKDKTDNPDGQVAKGLEELASSPSLTVNGTVWNISEVKYNNKTVTASQNLCDTFYQVTSCSDGEVCDDNDSVPKCSPIKDSNYQLIIGLSVGIPLFFILVAIIAVIIYKCVKRRKQPERPDTPEDRFHSIFARQIPTKGSWGPAAYRGFPSYTPDTMSLATSISGGQLFKQHRRQYTDAHNSSWFDSSRGAGNIDSHPRHYWSSKDGSEAPTSNFSWEYMFRILEPHRDFEIQRPVVNTSPNPTYTSDTQPDSLA